VKQFTESIKPPRKKTSKDHPYSCEQLS